MGLEQTYRTVHDFYAIEVTLGAGLRVDMRTVYFKADRYSPYSGRLQTEHDILLAKSYKTEEGARRAMARLLEKKTIRPENKPVVVHYTETVVMQYERLENPPGVVIRPAEAELDEHQRAYDEANDLREREAFDRLPDVTPEELTRLYEEDARMRNKVDCGR